MEKYPNGALPEIRTEKERNKDYKRDELYSAVPLQ